MTTFWHNFFPISSLPASGAFQIVSTAIVLLVLAWSLFWKGKALWRAAHLEQKRWFVALLILNTFGILEILYLFIFSKKAHAAARERANPTLPSA